MLLSLLQRSVRSSSVSSPRRTRGTWR